MAIKPDILKNILSDAETAKHIEGKEHSYTPEEYNKLAAKHRAMGMINDTSADGTYQADIPEGSVEFDSNGNLRRIKRNNPMLLDLGRYTANRFIVEKVGVPEEGEKAKNRPGTYILVAFGELIVNAISANTELPRTVKVFRFKLKQKKDDKGKVVEKSWKYVRSEFVKNDIVYQMTGHLKAEDALKLMQQVEEFANSADDRLEGESLDDIA